MSPKDHTRLRPAAATIPGRIRAALAEHLGIAPGDAEVTRSALTGDITVTVTRGAAKATAYIGHMAVNLNANEAIRRAVDNVAELLGMQGRELTAPVVQPLVAGTDPVQVLVLRDLVRERARQERLHPNDAAGRADLSVFYAALHEELGEFSKAVLEEGEDSVHAYQELVQAAAVAMARAEGWRRRTGNLLALDADGPVIP